MKNRRDDLLDYIVGIEKIKAKALHDIGGQCKKVNRHGKKQHLFIFLLDQRDQVGADQDGIKKNKNDHRIHISHQLQLLILPLPYC